MCEYIKVRQNKFLSLKLTQRCSSWAVNIDFIMKAAYFSSQMQIKYRKRIIFTLFLFKKCLKPSCSWKLQHHDFGAVPQTLALKRHIGHHAAQRDEEVIGPQALQNDRLYSFLF